MEVFETKAMPGQITVDEAEGIVECFVAGIGNKDSVGDIVLPGAFTASLQRRKPRVVWGHDWNQPIGKVLEIYEVPPSDSRLPDKMRAARIGGLYAKVQFNLKAERGREAFANVMFFGMDQEWSIGYKTLDAVYDNARQANLLKEVELYEVSPVLHGANQLTGTISIKSDSNDDRVTSFKKSKWTMFDRRFAEMIKQEHPDIWDAGGNIKGDDQYTILTRIAEQGGVAKTPSQIDALELREAWVARHKGDFRLPGVIAQIKWLAVGSRGEDHMKKVVRDEIKRRNQKKSTKADQTCPPATQNVQVNISNRQKAIDSAGYGPLNPSEANTNFWSSKARRWDVTPEDARKQVCGNCAAFIKTPEMLECIKGGLAAGGGLTGNRDAMDVIAAGDLGYCEAFDFKCASARTCDAWITGGPITESRPEDDQEETKGHGWDDEAAMIEAMRQHVTQAYQAVERAEEYDRYESEDDVEEIMANSAMGRNAVLARALANEMRVPVRIRTVERNIVVFDIMGEDDTPITMRTGWHAEGGEVMLGRPERVRVETVYLPMDDEGDGQAYSGDMSESFKISEIKAPVPPDVIPQERITGDVLRGYGPRRGNLERLLRYWRPIMRKPGGFRRCRVILANHPELYPLENICAWLHHETTGLWPNEGCHHPGMKNCRRKLRGVVRGSLWSDGEFNDRLERLKPNGGKKKGMPDPFEDDDDEDVITDEDIEYANKVLAEFMEQEKEFMEYLADEKNWGHYGDDEDDDEVEHDWVMPDNAPAGVTGKKPGGCGCGCSGAGGKGSCMDMPKSVEESLDQLRAKIGRSLNSENAAKISQAIDLLTEVIGGGPTATIRRKGSEAVIESDVKNLFHLRESIDPVIDYYDLDAEVTEHGISVKGLNKDSSRAIDSIVSNFANGLFDT